MDVEEGSLIDEDVSKESTPGDWVSLFQRLTYCN